MQQPIWVAIEPKGDRVQVLVSEAERGTVLKARLPMPKSKHALRMLLEVLSHWMARPLVAVLDADAEEVAAHPERWAVWLSDVDDLDVTVRWLHPRRLAARDRYFDGQGDFHQGKRLIGFASGGQR